MSADAESRTPRIEIRPPRFLTPLAMLLVWAFGLLLVIPLVVSALVVSLYSFGSHTLILPIVAVLLATWFLPFGFGNPAVSRLVRSQRPVSGQERFVVQLKLAPRLATGLRAVIDDADDFGSLTFNPTALLYEGDSVTLEIPYDSIRAVEAQSIGWRGLFLYEPRIAVTVFGLPDIDQLEFTERSSWVLPTSRKVSKALYQRLSAAVPSAART
jgi:hypothetical protein